MAEKGGKKNYCFVLSNMTFLGGEEDLPAYQKDVDCITNTFRVNEFDLYYEQNKTADEIESIVIRWTKMDFSNSDCLVMFILSHGKENGVIYGTDEEPITVDFIQSLLDDIVRF